MRYSKIICITGDKESGKSEKVRDIIQKMNKRTIVNDHSFQPMYKDLAEITLDQVALQRSGVYKTYDSDHKRFFRILYEDWGIKSVELGGLAIVEDASAVLGAQKDDDIYKMLIGLRHRRVDVVLVTHTIKETPRYIIPQLNEFVFLKTGDSWDEVKDRFPEKIRDNARDKFYKVMNDESNFAWDAVTIVKTGSKVWL